MAEFCKACFIKMEQGNESEIILSSDVDICEGCGKLKRVVMVVRPRSLLDEIRDMIVERRLRKHGYTD